MRITRRGQSTSAYKKTATYTQVMSIILGMSLLGIGLFSMLEPSLYIFPAMVDNLMVLVGVGILLFGMMTPLSQVFKFNQKKAFLVSSIIVLLFIMLIFGIIYGVGMNG